MQRHASERHNCLLIHCIIVYFKVFCCPIIGIGVASYLILSSLYHKTVGGKSLYFSGGDPDTPRGEGMSGSSWLGRKEGTVYDLRCLLV